MAQNTRGIHAVLSLPIVYTLFGTTVGALAARKKIIRQYVQPKEGDRILDIGCGPGDVVGFLSPGVKYVGFDESPGYIQTAKRRFGHRAEFHCDRVGVTVPVERGCFDVVLALGILHHLDDGEALDLFRLSRQALKPGGRLYTLDGCYVAEQSRWVRWFLDNDRGKNIRTQEAYLLLAKQVFSNVSTHIREDIFWIPYTALILECKS
jgi:SAM-dependent methyltransferase